MLVSSGFPLCLSFFFIVAHPEADRVALFEALQLLLMQKDILRPQVASLMHTSCYKLFLGPGSIWKSA